MSILQEICDKKRQHVAAQKSQTKLADLKARSADQPPARGFINALEKHDFPAIIAEVKKASPSKGLIRADFNPAEIAEIYEQNGAACMSVLTDAPYFQGSDQIFTTVRKTTNIPLLRKDFMVDTYQIHESRAMGADCILIIMAALPDDEAAAFYETASELGMDSLIEIHDEEELERALKFSPRMIGVNNRNLKTMDVSIETSKRIAKLIPDTAHKVAESGLTNFTTLGDLKTHGYGSFLIGESLMRQPDIANALKKIRGTE